MFSPPSQLFWVVEHRESSEHKSNLFGEELMRKLLQKYSGPKPHHQQQVEKQKTFGGLPNQLCGLGSGSHHPFHPQSEIGNIVARLNNMQ